VSDRLGWRMLGAIHLLNAAQCGSDGGKYADLSSERIMLALCSVFWMWMAFKAWRRELRAKGDE
jgi:hypothetical protein